MLDIFIMVAKISQWALVVYSWVHIIAFLLSWIHADPYNPIVSFINRITIPLWNWVRVRCPRVLESLAPFMALMLIYFGEIFVPGTIRSIGGLAASHFDFIDSLLNISFYFITGVLVVSQSIIWFIFILAAVWFVMTLVNPPLNNPIVQTILFIVDPLITPLQRVLPRTRVDLSPIVLAVGAFFVTRLISLIIVPIQTQLLI